MDAVTDYRTGAVDRIPLTNPLDWNARISTSEPPRDRFVWIVTWEGGVYWVSYYPEASWWLRKPVWARDDGETPNSFEADEIAGWTSDQEDAEEAAALLDEVA